MLALALWLTLAQPEAPPPAEPVPHPLVWSPVADGVATGAFAVTWALSEFAFKRFLAPPACRWCETNAFDDAARRAFVPDPSASSKDGIGWADAASNVTCFGLTPLASVGVLALLGWKAGPADGWPTRFGVDALLVFEATFGAMVVNQLVKFSVGRARPFVSSIPVEQRGLTSHPTDNDLSFYSGHSTFTFALVAASATVAQLRGYRHAWLIWAAGTPFAAATALLRMAADKHWASDVLIGTLSGLAFGIGVPWLFHRRETGAAQLTIAPLPQGLALVGRF